MQKLKDTPISVIVFWFSLCMAACDSIIVAALNEWYLPREWKTWLKLVGIGILGVLDQFFMTFALRYETANVISVVRTLNIVLAFVWDVVLLSGSTEWTSILGACLISSCVISLALLRWNKERSGPLDAILVRVFPCFYVKKQLNT